MLRYGFGFHIPFVPCSVAERNGHKYGYNENDTYVYNTVSNYNPGAYLTASNCGSLGYQLINTSLESLHSYLSAGYPIIVQRPGHFSVLHAFYPKTSYLRTSDFYVLNTFNPLSGGIEGPTYGNNAGFMDLQTWLNVSSDPTLINAYVKVADAIPLTYSSQKTFKIDINQNGGIKNTNSFTLNFGQVCNLSSSMVTRSGYTLKGWYLRRDTDYKWFVPNIGWLSESEISQKGYSKQLYTPNLSMKLDNSWGSDCSVFPGAFTFYAVWKPNTYSISVDANSGNSYKNDFSLNFGELCELTSDLVSKSGYNLKGWYFYRPADEKWYTDGSGWHSESEINQGLYDKKLYPVHMTLYIDNSWIKQAEVDIDSFVWYAVWESNHEHAFIKTITQEPTCTENGVITYSCSCGETYTESLLATGHSYTNYIYDNNATCIEYGTETALCDNGCGEVDTVVLETSTLEHSFTNYVSNDDGNCTEDGTKTAVCDYGCGATDTIVDEGSAAHRYTREQILREPTCTRPGYKILMCDCGTNYTDIISTIAHVYTEYKYNNDATCMADGTKSASCDYGCGNINTLIAENTLSDHKYTNYIYNRDATCTADGTKTAYCDYDCGNTDTIIAKGTITEHSYVADILEESTCVTSGLVLYMCSSCNAFYSENLPISGHTWSDWTVTTVPTTTSVGSQTRNCSVCSAKETEEIPLISSPETPEIIVDNYTITISNAIQIRDMRYALGEYTTTAEIKAAEGNVALSNSVVVKNTVDGNFVYEMPNGGFYTVWIRMQDGTNYILPLDVTQFTPSVSTYGVTVTLHDLYDVKDFYIAKGEYETYREIKDNGYIVSVTGAKIGNKHDYTYTVYEPGMHTILIRYNDGTTALFHEELVVDEPVFTTNGLQVTVSNLPDVKVIRTAYGEWNTVKELKATDTIRNFSAKTAIKGKDPYTIQYREEGTVTVIVEYNNGYVKAFHHNIEKKTPTVEQNGNTVTFGDLDGLVMVRYAKGEYTTSSQIKAAKGSKSLKSDAIVDGKITVTLDPGTYTFCVQYDDESYNYYTVIVE